MSLVTLKIKVKHFVVSYFSIYTQCIQYTPIQYKWHLVSLWSFQFTFRVRAGQDLSAV